MDNQKASTPRKILVQYFFDIVAPFLGYLIVHWFGARAVWALTVGGLIAGISTAVNTVRNKGLDRVGSLVLLEIATSIVLIFVLKDPRLLLIRPSFYTAVAAGYLIFTVFIGRPISFDGAKPMATQGDPVRIAAYEQVWKLSPEFRRTHMFVTLGFGVALALDSILRVVIVYRYPLERSMWLSNMPHVAAMVLIIVTSALAGRRFERIASETVKQAPK
jgi:hypothetical protein